MAERNVIQREIDEFGRAAGMTKHSGSWYRVGDEVTVLVNLQKSQYEPSYYLNVGVWFPEIESLSFPKENQCHVRTRVEALVPEAEARLKKLLDMQSEIPESEREQELHDMLGSRLLPVLNQMTTLASVRHLRRQGVLKFAAVRGQALALLDGG